MFQTPYLADGGNFLAVGGNFKNEWVLIEWSIHWILFSIDKENYLNAFNFTGIHFMNIWTYKEDTIICVINNNYMCLLIKNKEVEPSISQR